jgi:spore coat polysaccharide biosynthesis predicted glycosyltransferase SpsG
MKTVLFRTDGGTVADVGTGHIHRSLLLAERLRDECRIVFTSLNLPGTNTVIP